MSERLPIAPYRLTLARHFHGLTATDLAHAVGLTAGRISQMDRGGEFPAATVQQLALKLSVPPAFLADGEAPSPEQTPIFHYRHAARTPAWKRHLEQSKHFLFVELLNLISQYFEKLAPPAIPKGPNWLRGERTPAEGLQHAEACAQQLRREWGMGDGPIPNLISLLEARGIWVHELGEGAEEIDAFSCWEDGQAFIMLNPAKGDTYRKRLDAAHELGHLVMHDGLDTGSRELETEAFRFGGAFLLPAVSWRAEAPRSSRLEDYIAPSRRWRMAIAALVRRSYDLALIREGQYRTLMVRLSEGGYRKNEAQLRGLSLPENPIRLLGMLEVLSQNGFTLDFLCKKLHWPDYMMREVLGEHAWQRLTSSNIVSLSAAIHQRAHNRVPEHEG